MANALELKEFDSINELKVKIEEMKREVYLKQLKLLKSQKVEKMRIKRKNANKHKSTVKLKACKIIEPSAENTTKLDSEFGNLTDTLNNSDLFRVQENNSSKEITSHNDVDKKICDAQCEDDQTIESNVDTKSYLPSSNQEISSSVSLLINDLKTACEKDISGISNNFSTKAPNHENEPARRRSARIASKEIMQKDLKIKAGKKNTINDVLKLFCEIPSQANSSCDFELPDDEFGRLKLLHQNKTDQNAEHDNEVTMLENMRLDCSAELKEQETSPARDINDIPISVLQGGSNNVCKKSSIFECSSRSNIILIYMLPVNDGVSEEIIEYIFTIQCDLVTVWTNKHCSKMWIPCYEFHPKTNICKDSVLPLKLCDDAGMILSLMDDISNNIEISIITINSQEIVQHLTVQSIPLQNRAEFCFTLCCLVDESDIIVGCVHLNFTFVRKIRLCNNLGSKIPLMKMKGVKMKLLSISPVQGDLPILLGWSEFNLLIWNHRTGSLVQTIELTEVYSKIWLATAEKGLLFLFVSVNNNESESPMQLIAVNPNTKLYESISTLPVKHNCTQEISSVMLRGKYLFILTRHGKVLIWDFFASTYEEFMSNTLISNFCLVNSSNNFKIILGHKQGYFQICSIKT